MLEADENRLTPGLLYKIDPRGKTRYHSTEDHAKEPLFSYVDPNVFKRETFRGFIALLDNYESEGGQKEAVRFISV
ncbi:uridylate-specific endoribonuclease B-like [Montipora foliosa]|uniref:uridylate-specific endoribonuclease B-like n=1 Tax=Montipora foliosa TaxID=591990 RepID=UPI0035F0FD44